MPTDRVLIEIVTAANMAGVKQAQAGFLGMNVATLALAAGLGAAIFVGKEAIKNYEAQQGALLSVAQAVDVYDASHRRAKIDVGELNARVHAFIQTNKAYIANQYDVSVAVAAAVRAGNNERESMRLLSDALDIMTLLKLPTLSEAMTILIKAETGSTRALKAFGITSKEVSDIMKKHESVARRNAELLALIEKHTRKGKEAQTELEQSQHKLNIAWQDFTSGKGPAVNKMLVTINTSLEQDIGWLNQGIEAWTNFWGAAANAPTPGSGGKFGSTYTGSAPPAKGGHSRNATTINLHIDGKKIASVMHPHLRAIDRSLA